MDKNRVKLAIWSAEDDVCVVINKFLDADRFSFLDLCWWWNPNRSWHHNKKYANKILSVLIEEKCCEPVGKRGGYDYRKTEEFVELLWEMLRVEELTREI